MISIMREFRIRGGEGTLFLAYTDNIVNGDAIQNFIMTNVMARCEMQGTEGLLQSLMEEVIAIGELTKITTMEEVFDAVLLGDTVLLMDGDDFALQASTKHVPSAGRESGGNRSGCAGPEGTPFTELMSVNVVLTRRRIREYTAEGEAEEGWQTEQKRMWHCCIWRIWCVLSCCKRSETPGEIVWI